MGKFLLFVMLCCYSLIFNSEENAYLAVILFHLKAAVSTAVG